MINISQIVATWDKDQDGWSISPGVDWCPDRSALNPSEPWPFDRVAPVSEREQEIEKLNEIDEATL
jgi:hypothetical protein